MERNGTTGLPISDALANVITKGTVLRVGNEIVIVKSVTRTAGAGTIDVLPVEQVELMQ